MFNPINYLILCAVILISIMGLIHWYKVCKRKLFEIQQGYLQAHKLANDNMYSNTNLSPVYTIKDSIKTLQKESPNNSSYIIGWKNYVDQYLDNKEKLLSNKGYSRESGYFYTEKLFWFIEDKETFKTSLTIYCKSATLPERKGIIDFCKNHGINYSSIASYLNV